MPGEPTFRAKRPPSLAQHVRDVLADDIRSGRLRPGDHLAEDRIMRGTRVSRTTVREGVRLLEAEGLVAVSRNRGARVVRPLTRSEAGCIYRCRLAIEPELTALAAERLTAADIDALDALVEGFARSLEDGDPARVAALDAELHDAIYRAADSPLLGVFRAYWNKLQIDLTRHVYDREAPRVFHDEHLAIVDALRRRDARVASRRMREHIEHGRAVIERAFEAGAERP